MQIAEAYYMTERWIHVVLLIGSIIYEYDLTLKQSMLGRNSSRIN